MCVLWMEWGSYSYFNNSDACTILLVASLSPDLSGMIWACSGLPVTLAKHPLVIKKDCSCWMVLPPRSTTRFRS